MKSFNTNFDDLHMMDAVYGEMIFDHDRTVIEVLGGMEFMPEHPAYAIYGTKCPKVCFIFYQVARYRKTFVPYIEDSNGVTFGTNQVESKDWLEQKECIEYYLEGFKIAPTYGWLAVELSAGSFELQIQDEPQNG